MWISTQQGPREIKTQEEAKKIICQSAMVTHMTLPEAQENELLNVIADEFGINLRYLRTIINEDPMDFYESFYFLEVVKGGVA